MTDYVGRTLDQALQDLLVDYKQKYRVVRRDKAYKPVTRDYNPDRLNFEVEDDIIVKQYLG